MPTFNALVPVVDLIEAETAENAVEILRKRLIAGGFDPHEEGSDAFESEPL